MESHRACKRPRNGPYCFAITPNRSTARFPRLSLGSAGAAAPATPMRTIIPAPPPPPSVSIDHPTFFSPAAEDPQRRPATPVAQLPALTTASTLGACALPYSEHLRRT